MLNQFSPVQLCATPQTVLSSYLYGDSLGKDTGVGCYSLFQEIFPTQRSNLCLLLLLTSPAMAGRFFTTEPLRKPQSTAFYPTCPSLFSGSLEEPLQSLWVEGWAESQSPALCPCLQEGGQAHPEKPFWPERLRVTTEYITSEPRCPTHGPAHLVPSDPFRVGAQAPPPVSLHWEGCVPSRLPV